MSDRYVPAAGRRRLIGLYDPFLALAMRGRTFRRRLILQTLAAPAAGDVLDVGCGTGTLTLALAAGAPGARVVGLDGDPNALARARAKAAGASGHVRWIRGLADALPFDAESFDRVVCSLVLHHLSPGVRRAALAEIRRVLRPGGRLHVAEWGRPRDPLTAAAFLAVRLLDGLENTREPAAGALPGLIAKSGLAQVAVRDRLRTAGGSLELISAVRSAERRG